MWVPWVGCGLERGVSVLAGGAWWQRSSGAGGGGVEAQDRRSARTRDHLRALDVNACTEVLTQTGDLPTQRFPWRRWARRRAI